MTDLTAEELDRYTWQMWTAGFGKEGQRKLKNSSVLISRAGGIGGTVALYLAAAGIGKLIIAHGGALRRNDLNRQLLMSTDAIGTNRVDRIPARIAELNPHVEVVAVPENISPQNADSLVAQADVVVGCAPLFAERFAMNDAAVRSKKCYIDCAMYDFEFHLFVCLPGQTACLRCLYPENPAHWKREFPVFGAVSGTVAAMGAMETIKHLAGLGQSLAGHMLIGDLSSMSFRRHPLRRLTDCPSCGSTSTTQQK